MEPIISFWEKREFGDLIGSPFNFLRQEFKSLMRILLKYAGSFLAFTVLGIGLLSYNNFGDRSYTAVSGGPEVSWQIIIFVLFAFIGFFATFLLVNSYIALYVKAGKDNFSEADVLELAKRKILPAIGAGLLVMVMVIVGIILLYIPGIYLAIALSFVFIALIYEDLDAGQSISRSFQVVKGKWWFTFATTLVFGLIIQFSSYFIFIIPTFLFGALGFATGSFGLIQVLSIALFAAFSFFFFMIIMILQQSLIAFLYFSILTEKEGGQLQDKVDRLFPDYERKPEDLAKYSDEMRHNEEDNDQITEEKDEKKSDDYNRFADPNSKNRFSDNNDDDDDDDTDPYKPKY